MKNDGAATPLEEHTLSDEDIGRVLVTAANEEHASPRERHSCASPNANRHNLAQIIQDAIDNLETNLARW